MDQVAFIADQIMGPISSCSISGVNIVVFFIVRAKNTASDLYLSIVLREISHFQFRDLKYSSAYLHKKKERLHDVLPCKILNSFQRELRNKPAGDHIPGILLELLYRQRYVRSCGIPIP